MSKTQTLSAAKEVRIAVFVSLDTEHGRSILRGIAHYYRLRQGVTVLKFGQTAAYDTPQLKRLRLSGAIAKIGSRKDEEALLQLGIPVVNVSGQMEHFRVPTIDSDDARVGELALQHLYSRGHRRFAYCGNPRHHASQLRLQAFARAARRLEGAPEVMNYALPQGDQSSPYSERVRESLGDWLQALPKPIGVFTFTDRVAVEVEEACVRLDLKVPDEVAILGVGNDLTRLEFSHVELSSVQLNTERIGLLAAESLDQCMQGRALSTERILVPPQKIAIRRSTDRYAVSDPAVGESLDFIRLHIGNAVYVEDIAKAVGLSRRALEMRFRTALGESVYEAVQRMKLDYAMELLGDFTLPIGEVAFATGFADQKAFARVFQARVKESPTAYRKRLEAKRGVLAPGL